MHEQGWGDKTGNTNPTEFITLFCLEIHEYLLPGQFALTFQLEMCLARKQMGPGWNSLWLNVLFTICLLWTLPGDFSHSSQ